MKLPRPHIGMRFEQRGCVYEISYVAHGDVRYRSTKGAHSHTMPYTDFVKFCELSDIRITHEPIQKNITEENCAGTVRRFRYVEAALNSLHYPTAIGALVKIVEEVAESIQDSNPPSPNTVAKWICKYRKEGPSALSEKTKPGNKSVRFSIEIELLINEGIREIYLVPERRDAIDVLSYIVAKATERGFISPANPLVRTPNKRTIQRRIRDLDPYILATFKKGPRVAEKLTRASGKSITSIALMWLVQCDSHQLDIIAVDPETYEPLGRPWVYTMLEIHTRMIVGVYISMFPPSATNSLGAFKDMITRPSRGRAGGIPSQIIPDNGSEFKNSTLHYCCNALAINISPAQAYEPNGKANMESFYKTLTQGIVQKMEGTTFSNIGQRGNYPSEKKAIYTCENIKIVIDAWLETDYSAHPHTETYRIPKIHWRELSKRDAEPLYLSEEAANALLRRPEIRSIADGRVLVDYIYYYSHALATLAAQGISRAVVLIDDLDLNSVLVKHPLEENTLILADSTNYEYTNGLTRYAHEEIKKIAKEQTQADLSLIGEDKWLSARYELLELIKNMSGLNKRARKRIRSAEVMDVLGNNTSDTSLSLPQPKTLFEICTPTIAPFASEEQSDQEQYKSEDL